MPTKFNSTNRFVQPDPRYNYVLVTKFVTAS